MPSFAEPTFVAYVLVFALSSLGCLAAAYRARRIEDPDTRRGLVSLLLLSGGWAAAHVGLLVLPTTGAKVAVYMAGLTVGIAATGAWLYFCSAYTGRSLHRNRTVRWLAVGAFVGIVAVKLTNPIHGYYFSTIQLAEPFPHLAIDHGVLHWLAMGLAYALAVVGYFMLYELFNQVGADARPLGALAIVTALPITLDVAGLVTPYLLELTYEPVGVAVFAVAVLFAYEDRFQSIYLAGGADEPVIVLSEEDRIRDYNPRAAALFPQLDREQSVGKPLSEVLPVMTERLAAGQDIVELDRGNGPRYYRLTANPFAAGRATLGRMVTITDVTERESYRRELERQNERLERFASMVSHDLRNPLNVARGRLDMASQAVEDDNLEQAEQALGRMEDLIEDLLALARTGQPIDELEAVSLAELAQNCFDVVETTDVELEVGEDLRFSADPERLQQLVENLYRNAIEHGDASVLRVGALDSGDGFYVEDDGAGIPEEDRESVFESGYTTAEGGTGFGLAIVTEIVDAHSWDIRVTDGTDGGARFEITDVELVE